MAFFKRKRKGTINTNVKVADIYVTTAMIISSHYDESGCGPMCVTMYFFAKCEDGEYYELFSCKKLDMEKEPENGILCQSFDTPYVKKAEPFSRYMKNPNKATIDIQSLFDFITEMNVLNMLGAFSEEETSQEC